MLRIRQNLFDIIGTHTGKDSDTIKKDADRDYYMSAQEALDYGIIDKVMERNTLIGDKDSTTEKKD